jgi:hypothetical protein
MLLFPVSMVALAADRFKPPVACLTGNYRPIPSDSDAFEDIPPWIASSLS